MEHVSLLHVVASFGYMPRSVIAGSSGNSMPYFLRNHQTDLKSDCTSLQSHQQWKSVPPSWHPHFETLVLICIFQVEYFLQVTKTNAYPIPLFMATPNSHISFPMCMMCLTAICSICCSSRWHSSHILQISSYCTYRGHFLYFYSFLNI